MKKTYVKPEAETMALSTERAQMAATSASLTVSSTETLSEDESVDAKSIWPSVKSLWADDSDE